jgi:hypothetical protein
LSLSSLKYGFGIRDPRSGKNLFRIPDPGVKKTPDPGSRSATLVIGTDEDPAPDPDLSSESRAGSGSVGRYVVGMFLDLLDPDPLVIGTDQDPVPDPDPSIIKQKW